MGISLITPETFITDLWPDLIATCGSLNMQIVSYENNPENAREILSNLGKDIDIVVGNYSKKTKNYPNFILDWYSITNSCGILGFI